MSAVNNGYGGRYELQYVSDGRGKWGGAGYGHLQSIDQYVVSKVIQKDGRSAPVTIEYIYQDRCYDQYYSLCAQPETDNTVKYGIIAGHGTVQATIKGYNGELLRRTITQYNITELAKLGRPQHQEAGGFNGSTYIINQSTDTNYAGVTFANGIRFTYTNRVTSYQYDPSGNGKSLSTKTEYAYDPAKQGNIQYGNLTHIREFDSDTATVPYRTTIHTFYPNTTNWIVGLVGVTGVYQADTTTLLRATWTYYDGNNSNTSTPPSTGAVTRLSQVMPIACSAVPGGGGSGCAYARQTSDTLFTYDDYGNQTVATPYSGYGYRTFASNWALIRDVSPTGPASTTITYDTGYNLYPVQVSNPLAGHVTKFDIYGFKNAAGTVVPLNDFQKQPGLLKQVTDPNNVITKYEYDPFGRLHAIYDGYSGGGFAAFDGFADNELWNGNPVTRYRYFDNTWNAGSLQLAPFTTVTETRPGMYHTGSGGTGYELKQLAYYDGFGRVIQTQDRTVSVNGIVNLQDTIVTTEYSALGQVRCTTLPYAVDTYAIRGIVNGTAYLNHDCETAQLIRISPPATTPWAAP